MLCADRSLGEMYRASAHLLNDHCEGLANSKGLARPALGHSRRFGRALGTFRFTPNCVVSKPAPRVAVGRALRRLHGSRHRNAASACVIRLLKWMEMCESHQPVTFYESGP